MNDFLASVAGYEKAFEIKQPGNGEVSSSSAAPANELRPAAEDQWWWHRHGDDWWRHGADEPDCEDRQQAHHEADAWLSGAGSSWEATADDGTWKVAADWDASSWQGAATKDRSTATTVPPPPPPAADTTSSRSASGWRPRGGKNQTWYTVFYALKKTGSTDEVAKKAANAAIASQ